MLVAALAAPAPAPGSAETGFAVRDISVSPRFAYFAGTPVRMIFAFEEPQPASVQVDIVRRATRKPVRRLTLPPPAQPGGAWVERWDGLTGGGEVAPNGSYGIRLRGPDGITLDTGVIRFHSHIYPIRGPHADRGPIGAFGVGRNGGRTHQGFDVNAACGTKLVAARGGRVIRSDYDPVLYGNVVIVRGERTQRDYWYSHLERPSALRVGDRVRTGGRIGRVGATGNARTVGCHLHFEIRRRGVPIDPAPELHVWDRWS